MRNLIIVFVLLLIMSSCAVRRMQYGNYNERKCEPKEYKKGDDFYLFWGILPLKKTDRRIGIADYEKVLKIRFPASLIYYGSVGFFVPASAIIYVKDCDVDKKEGAKKNTE